MKLDRRDFIRLLGGAAGGIAVGAYGLSQVYDIPDKLVEAAKAGPGIVSWKATICGFCPGGCGLKFKLIDNLPVYVKGNPNYPVNSGGVCPLAHAALEHQYHPERIKQPLRRKSVAGSGKFAPISWDEAISEISDKLKALRSVGHPERFSFIGSDGTGLENDFIQNFMNVFGSPNYFNYSFYSNNDTANLLQIGADSSPAYDASNAEVICTLGANILETEDAPVYYTKLFSSTKGGSKSLNRFIHVSPHLDITGMFADSWIPIKPGTFGAFALGLAYVLIREELYDSGFIEKFTFGYKSWKDKSNVSHQGFKELVLGNYYPERVSNLTGIPSKTILELGRELGNNKPALVIGGSQITENTNGVYSAMAVNSLNALLGNIGNEGGILFPSKNPIGKFKPSNLDQTAKSGLKQQRIDQSETGEFPFSDFSINQFTENVLADKPYPIEALFVYRGNPIFQSLNKHQLSEAFKKIPLVVSFDSFINESNEYADLILPVNTFLEEWNESGNTSGVPFQHIGIRQPIVEKFYDSKQLPDVLIDISRNLDGSLSNSFNFDSYKGLIENRINDLFLSGKGAVTTEKVGGQWLEYVRERGWHIGQYESFDEFWELMLEKGGWWDPSANLLSRNEIFNTPSGRFEFYSLTLQNKLNQLNSGDQPEIEKYLNEMNISVRGDNIFLAHHEIPPHSEDNPIHLVMFRLGCNKDGTASNLPLMQEMFGAGVHNYWTTWAELSPATAEQYDIKDGEEMWITSDSGSIKVKARISPGVADDVVGVPFGLGHTSFGKYARGFGENPTNIMKNRYDMLNGKPAYQSTKVKISKSVGGV